MSVKTNSRIHVFLLLGYACLIAGWAGVIPPGQGPDEPDHYVKALAAARGQFVGRPLGSTEKGRLARIGFEDPGDGFRRFTRVFRLPARLVPGDQVLCNVFEPREPADCWDGKPVARDGHLDASSHVGTYQPFLYLVPGLVASLGSHPSMAIALGRGMFALGAFALVGMGISLLHRGGTRYLVAVPLTLSPMVIFTFATLSSSAIEVAAAFALGCAVVGSGLGGSPRRASRSACLAMVALVLARPSGASFLVVFIVAALLMRRGGALGEGRARVAAVSVVLGATVASLAWHALVMPTLRLDVSSLSESVRTVFSFDGVRVIVVQAIGVFGWLDTTMPRAAYLVWLGGVLVVVLAALLRAQGFELLGGIFIVATTLGIAVAITADFAPSALRVQGRYLLPLAMLIPLFAGASAGRSGWWRNRLGGVIAVAVMPVHFVAWWSFARREAVGTDGPVSFLGVADWSPAGGWLPWLTLVVIGVALLMVAIVELFRSPAIGAGRV